MEASQLTFVEEASAYRSFVIVGRFHPVLKQWMFLLGVRPLSNAAWAESDSSVLKSGNFSTFSVLRTEDEPPRMAAARAVVTQLDGLMGPSIVADVIPDARVRSVLMGKSSYVYFCCLPESVASLLTLQHDGMRASLLRYSAAQDPDASYVPMSFRILRWAPLHNILQSIRYVDPALGGVFRLDLLTRMAFVSLFSAFTFDPNSFSVAPVDTSNLKPFVFDTIPDTSFMPEPPPVQDTTSGRVTSGTVRKLIAEKDREQPVASGPSQPQPSSTLQPVMEAPQESIVHQSSSAVQPAPVPAKPLDLSTDPFSELGLVQVSSLQSQTPAASSSLQSQTPAASTSLQSQTPAASTSLQSQVPAASSSSSMTDLVASSASTSLAKALEAQADDKPEHDDEDDDEEDDDDDDDHPMSMFDKIAETFNEQQTKRRSKSGSSASIIITQDDFRKAQKPSMSEQDAINALAAMRKIKHEDLRGDLVKMLGEPVEDDLSSDDDVPMSGKRVKFST